MAARFSGPEFGKGPCGGSGFDFSTLPKGGVARQVIPAQKSFVGSEKSTIQPLRFG